MISTPSSAVRTQRSARGRRAEAWGRSAESEIEAWYAQRGGRVVGRRVRTAAGELDLIVRMKTMFVFVEVKARKRIETALEAVDARKLARLQDAALSFLCAQGLLDADLRFDVAAIGQGGAVAVVENVTQ